MPLSTFGRWTILRGSRRAPGPLPCDISRLQSTPIKTLSTNRSSTLLQPFHVVMFAHAPLSLRTFVSFQLRSQYGLARFGSQRISNKSSMEPKFSEGHDRDTVRTELDVLINNGWELNEEKKVIKKTYHLGTYTNVLVRYPTRSQRPR